MRPNGEVERSSTALTVPATQAVIDAGIKMLNVLADNHLAQCQATVLAEETLHMLCHLMYRCTGPTRRGLTAVVCKLVAAAAQATTGIQNRAASAQTALLALYEHTFDEAREDTFGNTSIADLSEKLVSLVACGALDLRFLHEELGPTAADERPASGELVATVAGGHAVAQEVQISTVGKASFDSQHSEPEAEVEKRPKAESNPQLHKRKLAMKTGRCGENRDLKLPRGSIRYLLMATYGCGDRQQDCMDKVRRLVATDGSLRVTATNSVLGGDPCPGTSKVLKLTYLTDPLAVGFAGGVSMNEKKTQHREKGLVWKETAEGQVRALSIVACVAVVNVPLLCPVACRWCSSSAD